MACGEFDLIRRFLTGSTITAGTLNWVSGMIAL